MSDDLLDAFLQQDSEMLTYAKEDEVLAPLEKELALIDDQGILDFTRAMLYNADPFFWTMPSNDIEGESPPDEYGEGGNILHIRRVVRMTAQMGIAYGFDQDEMDIVISAALLHTLTRGVPSSRDGSIMFDPFHPYSVDKYVTYRRMIDDQDSNDGHSSTLWLDDDTLAQILRIIRCQKGIWSPIPETIPSTTYEWVLHLADLLASNVHRMVDGAEIEEWRWIRKED